MRLTTKALFPLFLTATLALQGCGDKDSSVEDDAGDGDDTGVDSDSDDDTPVTPEGQTAGDCSDGADNDGDGLFDCDDDGCAGSPDCETTNTAPGSATIAIEPAEPTADDDLSCVIVTEASDPDGDELSYTFSWSVGGTSAELDEADISAALTAEGDEWTCSVVASDGELDGVAVGTSVTIPLAAPGWIDIDAESIPPSVCAIDPEHQAHCWADESLGLVDDVPSTPFQAISVWETALGDVRGACGTTTSGTIECWPADPGWGDVGVPSGSDFESIDCGLSYCCALDTVGSIECWGSNNGYSGVGQTRDFPTSSGHLQVSAGVYDACALTAEGTVQCWGKGERGAHDVPSGDGYIAVAAGYYGGCALDSMGSPTCWGWAAGSEPTISGLDQLFGHRHVFCGLDATGTATCWDSFSDDPGADDYDPNPPADPFATIGIGLYQVCGIAAAGEPQCWGELPDAFPY